MLSLPVELRLPIIHHVRDSITWSSFEDDTLGFILAIKQYNQLLSAVALYHREWTAIAQSELFKHLYIRDAKKLKLLLVLLRGSEDSRGYMKHSRSAVLGRSVSYWRDPGGRRDDGLVELGEYCPDLAEIFCCYMEIQLVRFRTSCAYPARKIPRTDILCF
jgi:hypothetical protein